MTELEGCLEVQKRPTDECVALQDELRDMEAFRDFLQNIWNQTEDDRPYASMVLLALHNIVTSSIDPAFNRQRRFIYCMPEVLQKLGQSAILKASALELKTAPQFASVAGVPGFGQHRLRNCSA